MPKTKTAPSTARIPMKKYRTRSVARSEANKLTASRTEYSDPEDEHADVVVPPVVDSTISKLAEERSNDIEIHYDIPGYHCIITHSNVIIHGVMARYNEKAHLWIVQCNKYENPLMCLRSGETGQVEVERPELFSCQMSYMARDNELETIKYLHGIFKPQYGFNLKSREVGYYDGLIHNLIDFACEVLDKGD
ncbi:hypothetical protein H4219_004699, partial [Mycoemilia scoparia]